MGMAWPVHPPVRVCLSRSYAALARQHGWTRGARVRHGEEDVAGQAQAPTVARGWNMKHNTEPLTQKFKDQRTFAPCSGTLISNIEGISKTISILHEFTGSLPPIIVAAADHEHSTSKDGQAHVCGPHMCLHAVTADRPVPKYLRRSGKHKSIHIMAPLPATRDGHALVACAGTCGHVVTLCCLGGGWAVRLGLGWHSHGEVGRGCIGLVESIVLRLAGVVGHRMVYARRWWGGLAEASCHGGELLVVERTHHCDGQKQEGAKKNARAPKEART